MAHSIRYGMRGTYVCFGVFNQSVGITLRASYVLGSHRERYFVLVVMGCCVYGD